MSFPYRVDNQSLAFWRATLYIRPRGTLATSCLKTLVWRQRSPFFPREQQLVCSDFELLSGRSPKMSLLELEFRCWINRRCPRWSRVPCCGVRATSAPTAFASWRARCMGCSPVASREVQIDSPATRSCGFWCNGGSFKIMGLPGSNLFHK